MFANQSFRKAAMLLAALAVSLMTPGRAPAQHVRPAFLGKFTLTTPVHWGGSVLQPGEYTIRIDSTASLGRALISNKDSTFAIRVLNRASEDYRGGPDALQLRVKNGELVVRALVLADLNRVLIYDSSLDKRNVEEARNNASVPVLVARK